VNGRRSLRVPVLLLWFVVLWVALWGQITAANVLSGVVVAGGVVLVTRLPRTGRATYAGARIRPIRAVRFGVYFLAKVVQANVTIAWEVVTPRNTIAQGIIGITLRDCSDALVTMIANSYTLTPGSLTIEVERHGDASTVYLHVLHLADRDQVRSGLITLAHLAVRAFGSDAALAQFGPGGSLDLAAARSAAARSAAARSAAARSAADGAGRSAS